VFPSALQFSPRSERGLRASGGLIPPLSHARQPCTAHDRIPGASAISFSARCLPLLSLVEVLSLGHWRGIGNGNRQGPGLVHCYMLNRQ
jgi:hypothetical protein